MTRHVEISEKAEKMPQREVEGKEGNRLFPSPEAKTRFPLEAAAQITVRLRPCSFPSRYVGKSRYCGFYSKGDAR